MEMWKICPIAIYKGSGSKIEMKSYRPIALLPVQCVHKKVPVLTLSVGYSQWAGAYFRLYELSQKVWWYPGPLWKPPQMFGQIAEFRFFEKINILCFGGPKKLFWAPKTSYCLRNPTFGGVILLELFDPIYGFGDFQDWLCQKSAILPSVAPKP